MKKVKKKYKVEKKEIKKKVRNNEEKKVNK